MRTFKRNNKWAYDFRLKDKRYRKYGFKTKKEAEAAGNEKYNEVKNGFNSYHNISFAKYVLDWIEVYKKDYVSTKTYSDYQRIYRKIDEYFENTEMKDVTRVSYQQFLTAYKNKLSQDQLGRINALCKKVVETAIYDGLITKNFTFNAQVTSAKPHVKLETDKYLNLDELANMKRYFENKIQYLAPSTHIILVMIETGGRFSDCINLKREDINEVKGELFLNGTKNDSAPRYVTVSNELIRILLDYANKRPASMNGYLFTYAGEQITNSTVNKAIKNACADLNITRNITSHAFRHTHASYLIHKGINIYYISKRLGHSDISVTLNKYGHLLKEGQKQEDERTLELIKKI